MILTTFLTFLAMLATLFVCAGIDWLVTVGLPRRRKNNTWAARDAADRKAKEKFAHVYDFKSRRGNG